MQKMAIKQRATVKYHLDKEDFDYAHNLAMASSFFAREMECVSGREPRLDPVSTERVDQKIVVMKPEEYRANEKKRRPRIEAIVLNPKEHLASLTEDTYRELLSRVLSEDDLHEVEAIRARREYWTQLKTSFKRSTF
jgi:hypothetical protein